MVEQAEGLVCILPQRTSLSLPEIGYHWFSSSFISGSRDELAFHLGMRSAGTCGVGSPLCVVFRML